MLPRRAAHCTLTRIRWSVGCVGWFVWFLDYWVVEWLFCAKRERSRFKGEGESALVSREKVRARSFREKKRECARFQSERERARSFLERERERESARFQRALSLPEQEKMGSFPEGRRERARFQPES